MNVTGSAQDTINARVYHRAGVERQYQEWRLMRPEGIALLKYQPAFAYKDVLDIGAGTGRTTIYLAPLAHRYQAIDYSLVMTREFERMFPDIPMALADMRDLTQFDDASFDFVLASNNVFDAVAHEGRLRALQEIHRVLRPGGTLMFSTHNRDSEDAVHGPRMEFSRNPVTQLKLAVHWGISVANHMHRRRLQTFAEDYSIINDEPHAYALLHYYIGPDAQWRQLAEQGFEVLDAFDRWAVPVPRGDRATGSSWLLYVARRVAGG